MNLYKYYDKYVIKKKRTINDIEVGDIVLIKHDPLGYAIGKEAIVAQVDNKAYALLIDVDNELSFRAWFYPPELSIVDKSSNISRAIVANLH